MGLLAIASLAGCADTATMKYFACLVFAATAAAWGSPLEIRFAKPAKHWDSETLPVGNGRLGAVVFGDPARDRIQFNEDSLWTGTANESGGYDQKEFGTYQSFGDLFLTGPDAAQAAAASGGARCASGQQPFVAAEGVEAAGDGNPATKWCVEHGGKPVVWQTGPAEARAVASYSFTSADDVPARDPRTWKFEGSTDGQHWITLDEHKDEAPFARRGETKRYTCANPKACSSYRFVFAPAADAPHFQVAEISLDGAGGQGATDATYSRWLDLATGIHTLRWQQGGTTFTREVFASHPAQAIVVRTSADKPGAVAGQVALKDARTARTTAAGAGIQFAGTLDNGLRYAAVAAAAGEGGKAAADQDQITFSGCDAVTLVLAAATDYALDPAKAFRSDKDPLETATRQAAAALQVPYAKLRSDHVADHQPIMDRVRLDLPSAGEASTRPTPERLKACAGGAPDPGLEALLFQYGRYLLLGSSRPGDLPANLQGLWADGLKPAWFSDYHTNINLQMNYWLAEPANLAECHEPLLDWILASIPGSRRATLRSFGENTPGWTMRTSVNIFGGNGWEWNLPSSAWLAQDFWEHYAFTGDREFLRAKAWPVLRDVSEFWLAHLVEKDGKLVVPKGWSPEHGPREDGVAHDQQIVWDLFTNTLAAAGALDAKDAVVGRIAEARARLLGPQVGSWGQIMEWTTERPELEKSGHRHTSHLFALYPGKQISTTTTPEWAKAAAISLEARGTSGDSRRSWTWPWRTAMWARLGQPEKAHDMIRGLLTHNTLPNLWATHPPFQMDGNFGITAAICEMLVQSQAGEVAILPALPKAWADGSFAGLKARGAITVGAQWKAGTMVGATLGLGRDGPVVVRLPGNAKASVADAGGQPVPATFEGGTLRFAGRNGQQYTLTPGAAPARR